MQRKLAAVLAADIVGYSRLVQQDEEATLLRTKNLFGGLVEATVSAHGGRIAKTMGDGFLAEFSSATEAVKCAIEIQTKLDEFEQGYPEDSRIRMRIGINVGDIVVDSGDMFGDAVNIAARLESEAETGGICISGAVYDQVKLNFKDQCAFAGNLKLKNIDEHVRAYRIVEKGQTTNTEPAARPRIPFTLLSGVAAALIALTIGLYLTFGTFSENDSQDAAGQLDRIAVLPFNNLSLTTGINKSFPTGWLRT